MKRWQIFQYANEGLTKIQRDDFHGYNNAVPQGYHRGIDVIGPAFIESFRRSVWMYFRRHGTLPDLIDPQTFTEKQLLFKFFGLIPTLCPSDKLVSHLFLSENHVDMVSIPERIWLSERPKLPENGSIPDGKYYFKSNHSSGTNRSVIFPLSADERKELEVVAQDWLTRVHDSRGALWWYETMERFVYLEKDLSDNNLDAPDWKFFTCNGRVELFHVDTNRSGDHEQTVYARSGRFIDKEMYFKSGTPITHPPFLDKMVAVAEGIGAKFDFIRVDMFVKQNTFFLGEITLVPNGGTRRIRSPELDWKLGASWNPPWIGKVDSIYSTGHYC